MSDRVNIYYYHHQHHYGYYYYFLSFAFFRQESKCLALSTDLPVTGHYTPNPFSPHLLLSPPTPQTLNTHSSTQTITVSCSHLLPFLSHHPRFLTSCWIHLVANSRMFIQVFIITCVSETGMVSAKAGKRRKQGIKKIKNKSPPPHLKISVVDLHQSQRLNETSVHLNSNCRLPELV